MTIHLSKTTRRLLALAIAVSIPVLVWAALVQPVSAQYQAYQNEKANQTALLGKFQARASALPQLRRQRAELDERDTGSRGLLTADTDAMAAAQLQAAVTKLIVRGGGRVASMQVLPPAMEGDLQRVRVSANLRAPMSGFYDLLYEIEAATPFMFVDTLNIRSASGGRKGRSPPQQPTVLSIRLQVSSFRKPEVQ